MHIKPLYDRVVIQRFEEDKVTPKGIVIPGSAAEKSIKGKVVAIGKGKILANGSLCPLQVKTGDKVIFDKYAGSEYKVDGQKLLIIRENDIIAIIEN